MTFERLAIAWVCAAALVGCSRPSAEKVYGKMHEAACAGDATKFFAHIAEDRFVDDAVKDAWQRDINEKAKDGEICGWSFVRAENVGGKQRLEVRSKSGDKKFIFFDKVGDHFKLVDFQAIGGASAPSATVAQAAPPPSVLEETASARSKIGERVTFSDADWVVVEARNAGKTLKSNSEFVEENKTTTGRFIQVHYLLTNKSAKEEMLLDRPKLVDDESREYGAIDMESFYVPPKSKTVALDTLQPNVTKDYWTVIEVPPDATGLRFKVHGFDLLGPTKTVDVGL